ncbi:hypothetical protein [Dissulfurispira sp.]|uniref:hypothetical protein n=1 Tax=Dissulfurispira sp. TaxID=2817609 RepID=UPI002FDAC2AE
MFYDDSAIRFSDEKGFGESYYILCPVCWNSGIKVTRWEDGTEDVTDCAVCERMEILMDADALLCDINRL